jgi:tetratricopeptide (TPR) repeat protein
VREYSTREVAEISSLPAAQIRRWARAGLVAPAKDASGRWHFSFQDLALLRTAGRLLAAGVRPVRVTRALHQLRDQLPGRPLSAVRLVVDGKRVIVRDRLASWVLESRQGVFGFEMDPADAPEPEPAAPLPQRPAPEAAEALYRAALDLELAGCTKDAEAAYRAALEKNPRLVDARINLGRLLHTADRFAEAETLYRSALEQDPDNALATFNLGVALEDQDRTGAAIDAYRRAIGIDETLADAHFNLSRLLEAGGQNQAALRHLSRFRQLTRS